MNQQQPLLEKKVLRAFFIFVDARCVIAQGVLSPGFDTPIYCACVIVCVLTCGVAYIAIISVTTAKLFLRGEIQALV